MSDGAASVGQQSNEAPSSQEPSTAGETAPDQVERARRELLEGVGAEVASSFPGITRLGGQVVAALYLSDTPQSMDVLCATLQRSKSNIHNNLKGLEALGIVRRKRERGSRRDVFALSGPYPDVIVGAYIARLRQLVASKRSLASRSLRILGDAKGHEAELLRRRLAELDRKYSLFGHLMADLPATDGPVDLESLLSKLTPELLAAIKAAAAVAWRQDE